MFLAFNAALLASFEDWGFGDCLYIVYFSLGWTSYDDSR
jgi:hypothetical protein